ncbi:hypothetical protein EV401DRAFT_2158779 [Pisolithus croceorrhizus]|nr:hypothetical protein EV401DRAFT_2158779 [Pisolithus croceorrhizus]
MSSKALETPGDLPFTSSECAESRTWHQKPENKVVDMWHMVDVLPMFEVGSTGQAWYGKHVKEHQAPDKGGQHADNKVERSRDLPKSSSEVLKPVGNLTRQCTQTNSKMIANVPDPPGTPTKLPTPHTSSSKWQESKRLELDHKRALRCPKRTYQGHSTSETPPDEAWGMGVYSSARVGLVGSAMARSTATKLEIRGISTNMVGMRAILPDWAMAPSELDKEIGGGYNDPASRDITNLRRIGKALLNDRECQHSKRKTKRPEDLPVPPTPLRNPMMNPPKTFRDQRCHSRIKTDLQNLSMEQEPEWRQGSSPIPPALHLARTSYGYKASQGLRHRARLRSNAENKSWQAKRSMAVRNQPTWDNLLSKGDNGGRRHGDATRSGYADSCRVKESPLTDSGGQHSKYEEKRLQRSPAPPAPSPNSILDMPTLFTDLRRRGRLKLKAENVSNAHTRQNAYLTQTALKWPLPLLPTHSNRSLDATRGSWMTKVRCNETRRAQQVETRGRTHHTAGIYMQLPQGLSNPSKRLQNITNTYWREGVPPGSMRNDVKRPRNLRTAKRLPRSSNKRRDNEYRAGWPNDSPAPPKRPPNGLIYTLSTLRDLCRCTTIKTRSKNVSTIETRGSKASRLTVPIPPPCKLAKHLWNVANTYWRHGIPPGQTQNIEIRLLFDTTPKRQQYKARRRAHTTHIPKQEVATTQRRVDTATTHSLHTDSKLTWRRIHTRLLNY